MTIGRSGFVCLLFLTERVGAYRSHAIDLVLMMWRTKQPKRRRVGRERRRRRKGWARRRVMRLDHSFAAADCTVRCPVMEVHW